MICHTYEHSHYYSLLSHYGIIRLSKIQMACFENDPSKLQKNPKSTCSS